MTLKEQLKTHLSRFKHEFDLNAYFTRCCHLNLWPISIPSYVFLCILKLRDAAKALSSLQKRVGREECASISCSWADNEKHLLSPGVSLELEGVIHLCFQSGHNTFATHFKKEEKKSYHPKAKIPVIRNWNIVWDANSKSWRHALQLQGNILLSLAEESPPFVPSGFYLA